MRRRTRSLQVIIAFVWMGSIGARHTRTIFVISGVQPVPGDFTTVFYVSSILGRDRARKRGVSRWGKHIVYEDAPKGRILHMKRIHTSVILYTMTTAISSRTRQSHAARIYALRAFDTSSGAAFDCDPFWSERIYDNANNRGTLHFTTARPRFYDSKLFFERKKLSL